MSTVSARQLSFVDAGAAADQWGPLTPVAAAPKKRGRYVPEEQYEDFLEAVAYRQRDRDRSRRTKTLRAQPRPVASVYADRSAAEPRPVAKTETGPTPHRVQNRPDRSRSRGGLRGVTPELRTRVTPYSPSNSPNESPDRFDQVAALITSAGIPMSLTRADRRAIKSCPADPPEIAAAFTAAARGEWGGKWLRENLSMSAVVKRIHGWRNSRHSSAPSSPTMSPTAYSHDPWAGQTPPIAKEDLAYFGSSASA